MTSSVRTVTPDTTVSDLAQFLAESDISGVPVVDQQGRVIGVATETDIISRRIGRDTVRSIMSSEVIAVSEDESIEEIAFVLSMKRINRVPVLRQGKLVGIVAREDIVRAIARQSAAAAAARQSSD
jgi:CBS domain-containing protein